MITDSTLSHYLVEKQRANPIVTHELRLLIENIATACKAIGVAIDRKVDERLHPLRIQYYRKALEAQLESNNPSAALWPLLETWTVAAAAMSELRQPAKAWQAALEELGLLGSGFESHLQALDRFIDSVEELLDQLSTANGLSGM